MGRIGKYLDEMCRQYPGAMHRVLDMQVGSYCRWETCLVGTIRLARGASPRPGDDVDWRNGFARPGWAYDHQTGVAATQLAYWFGAKKTGNPLRFIPDGGMQFPNQCSVDRFNVAAHIGSTRISELAKARIRRRLAVPPIDFKLEFPSRPLREPVRDLIFYADQITPVWETALLAELSSSG